MSGNNKQLKAEVLNLRGQIQALSEENNRLKAASSSFRNQHDIADQDKINFCDVGFIFKSHSIRLFIFVNFF